MNLRKHLVLRCLAIVPVLAAVAIAQSQGDDADQVVAADAEPVIAVDTVAAMMPVSDASTIPPLFGAGDANAAAMDEGVLQPELIGIAGRLPDDVEVLLRMPEGETRSVRIGESIGDLRLVSATADRAVFSDRGRQVVLTLGPLP